MQPCGRSSRRVAVVLLLLLVLSSSAAAAHPLLDIAGLQRGVAAAHAEVTAALADPAKAFDAYLAKFAAVSAPKGHKAPAGPQDTRTKAERLAVFTDNLQRAADRNAAAAAAGQLLAYGITPFSHLTQAEFEQEYLGQVPAAAAAAAETAWPGSTTAAAPGAAAASTWTVSSEGTGDTADAEYADYEWAEPGAASRKLLARQQEQQLSAALLSYTDADAEDDMIVPSSTQLGLAAADAAGNTTTPAHALPPARQVPGGAAAPALPLPPAAPPPAAGAGGVVPAPRSLPLLPFNPEPEARGCTAQREYPYRSVVPPAEGVNWVQAGRTTPVKDQGPCGACVAFATTALAEFMHMRRFGTTNATTSLSEQDLLDCTVGDGCQGQFQTAYVDMIGCAGVALSQDSPYRWADDDHSCQPVRRRYSGMSRGSGGGWAAVPATSEGLAQAVSQAPVLVTLDATDWALYAGGVLDCSAPGSASNHAVAVVGAVNGELADMFIVRNSFGSWWGSGNGAAGLAGHILLPKGCGTDGTKGGSGLGPSALHALNGVVPLYG